MPAVATKLRAGAVVLEHGERMDWHSTKRREELLIALGGCLSLELRPSARAGSRRVSLAAGQCAWLPPRTTHRVVNRSATRARYIYVTAPVR